MHGGRLAALAVCAGLVTSVPAEAPVPPGPAVRGIQPATTNRSHARLPKREGPLRGRTEVRL